MPELPEVETTRRHLEKAMVGHVVTAARVAHSRTVRHNASDSELIDRLVGRRIDRVGRHGKFLVIDLDDGHKMVAHLGMSGRFSVDDPDTTPVRHTHFSASLDDGSEIRFIDPRTFGFVAVYDEDEMRGSGVGRLGPDAWLDPPTPSGLLEALSGRTAPIKALLLDQKPISGLGNIYADEALYFAGIAPTRPGGGLTREEAERLVAAIRLVLGRAIEAGGTTLEDLAYLLPDGRAGENLSYLRVYGRGGEPCETCGAVISRVVVRGRSTHFCAECQT